MAESLTADMVVSEPDIPAPEASTPQAYIELNLNDKPMILPPKSDGSPYYLMEMLELSRIDLSHPTGEIVLRVNGVDGLFLDELKSGDYVEIYFQS